MWTNKALVLTLPGSKDGGSSGQFMKVVTKWWVCFATYARNARLLLTMAAQGAAEGLACTCMLTVFSAMQNQSNMLDLLQRSMLCCRVVILNASLVLKPGNRSVEIGRQFLVHCTPSISAFSPSQHSLWSIS